MPVAASAIHVSQNCHPCRLRHCPNPSENLLEKIRQYGTAIGRRGAETPDLATFLQRDVRGDRTRGPAVWRDNLDEKRRRHSECEAAAGSEAMTVLINELCKDFVVGKLRC
jgi:hypothetical protein